MVDLSSFIGLQARARRRRLKHSYMPGADHLCPALRRRDGGRVARRARRRSRRRRCFADEEQPGLHRAAFASHRHLGAVFLPINYRSRGEDRLHPRQLGRSSSFARSFSRREPADVVLVDGQARRQHRTRRRPARGRRCIRQHTGRPVPPDVHLGHDRPSQGRHAHVLQLLLEVHRPRPGPQPRRPRRASRRRAALSRRRLRLAGHRGPLGRRQLLVHRDFEPRARWP